MSPANEGGTHLTATAPVVEVRPANGPDTWSGPRGGAAMMFRRSTLRKTIRIALIIGTLLSTINQGYLIWGGRATYVTWIRVVANYIVPFCVSSTGFLTARHRRTA